jgi:release factor glutamine methyltransferase
VKTATSSGVEAKAGELRTLLQGAIARLEQCQTPSAPLAAELLLMHVLRRDRAWFYAHPEYELPSGEAATFAELIERRANGVPTQYLTGSQEFWGLEFEVGPGVLIPRPETEHVIEVALSRMGTRRTHPLRVADIGTGSGCIAITLASELRQAEIIATDISELALDYARRNAARHGFSHRIHFRQVDILPSAADADGEASSAPERFDLLVSNPPYVARKDAPQLPREVRDHEPAEALFAGDQGLDFYPRLILAAERSLTAGGTLVLEIGYNGASFVRSLLSACPWSDVSVTLDLAGIERVISARLSPRPSH